MKKGQVIEGIVQRVDFPNKGIVACEEGTCVVKNALPGQKVKCAVNKVRKGKAEGRLLEVIEASPLETGSPCPHFGSCGGCTYISLPYEEQLRIKEEQVRKLMDSVFAVLVALIVMLSIQWVGILIINALLILPAASSRNIASNMREGIRRIFDTPSTSLTSCPGEVHGANFS